MTKQPRWIAPLLQEAAKCTTKMPWERGVTRNAMITRRNAAPQQQEKRASA